MQDFRLVFFGTNKGAGEDATIIAIVPLVSIAGKGKQNHNTNEQVVLVYFLINNAS